jgi:hypothetical protein
MCGLPRNGKTILATLLEHEVWIRVCPDDIRLALHGKPFVKEAESSVIFLLGQTDTGGGLNSPDLAATGCTRNVYWGGTFACESMEGALDPATREIVAGPLEAERRRMQRFRSTG